MAEISINYTDINRACPNPDEVMKAYSAALAGKFKDFVCSQFKLAKDFEDARYKELQDRVALFDAEDIASRLQAFQEFINFVDPDGNKTIDALDALRKEYTALKAYAELTRERSVANETAITNALQELRSFAQGTNTKLLELERKDLDQDNTLNEVKGSVSDLSQTVANVDSVAKEAKGLGTNNAQQIGSLKSDVEELKKLDLNRVDELTANAICHVWQKMHQGLLIGLDEANTIFNEGCNIYPKAGLDSAPPEVGNENNSAPPEVGDTDGAAPPEV